MNQDIEALRERIAKQYIEVPLGDETWRIGKLLAVDSIKLSRMLTGAENAADDKDEQLVPYYAALLSKTIQRPDGSLKYDSDEGRELLARLDVLMDLGIAASEFNTSKKK